MNDDLAPSYVEPAESGGLISRMDNNAMPDNSEGNSIGSKRVGFLFWEGYLGVAPSLINATRVLASAGYEVDIITRRTSSDYAQLPRFPDTVRIYFEQSAVKAEDAPGSSYQAKEHHWAGSVWRAVVPYVCRRVFRDIRERYMIILELKQFVTFGLACMHSREYVAVVGIDMLGLIAATGIALRRRTPVIYWSLELAFLKEFTHWPLRLLKRLERLCNRRAAFTIIQDTDRAESLVFENSLKPGKIILVPNGPLGLPLRQGSDFFQRKFKLAERKLLLHIGLISHLMYSLEIAKETANWPEDWALVFHERAKRDMINDIYLRTIAAVGGRKVFLSLDPVAYDDLNSVVASAQIGLVFYRDDLGPNLAQIAGASGKMGQYLRCGLPVICSDLPGLRMIIEKYRCGVCVKEFKDIEGAVKKIFEDYGVYRSNAFRCYEEVYEFGVHFKKVMAKIHEFSGQKEAISMQTSMYEGPSERG